ncbi:uncharacterized protein LOC128809150 [Vidua macroura]|uniref:uncharacterized protein LOC128809150 n=1 Tax=Vidua macroura TaxID=187451 RepID=UPI0023A82E1B|nr:uncharacterized protein LOC128809150 [Vidua macroura]
MQGKHSAGRGLFPVLVLHRLHSRDTLSLQTPPLLRPTGSGVGNRPQRGQLETLRGEVRTLRPGCWRPGSCSRCSPCARSPGAPQVQVPELPRPDAAAGRRERGAGRGAPRPTQAGGGRQLLPAHRVRRAGAEQDPPGAPRALGSRRALLLRHGPLAPPGGETMGTMTSPFSNLIIHTVVSEFCGTGADPVLMTSGSSIKLASQNQAFQKCETLASLHEADLTRVNHNFLWSGAPNSNALSNSFQDFKPLLHHTERTVTAVL